MSSADGTALLNRVRTGDEPHDVVLDGALSGFLDFGIRRTSMGEIARRSGVSPATLYRRYSCKDELVAAVGLRETRRFLAAIEAKLDPTAPAVEQLTEVFVLVSRHLREQPLLRRMIETEPESILPRLTIDGGPIIDAGAAYLAGHIERMMDDGLIARFDPRPLAELLARVTHSMLLTPATSMPDDDVVRSTTRDAIRWLIDRPTGDHP